MSDVTAEVNSYVTVRMGTCGGAENSDVYWHLGLRRVGKRWRKVQRERENQETKLALREEDNRVKLFYQT